MLRLTRPSSSPQQRPCSSVVCTRPRTMRCRATSVLEPSITTTNEDFYGILSIDPNASNRDIRRAYIELMRDFHPDQYSSGDSSEMDSANELCALLNEIYETLSDPDKRSTYDALVGFAAGAVNPFKDNTHERDQVFVDELSCIGCAMCVRTCPSTFELESSKYARARAVRQAVTVEEKDEVAMAIETCPVDCISYVTLPQLPLLETALSTMARTDVFVMRRTGRSGPSVFDGAIREWQRRQAAIENKMRSSKVDWQWWQAASQHVDDIGGMNAREEARAPPTSADGRRIARLAAVAARAARMWRSAGGSRKVVKGLIE